MTITTRDQLLDALANNSSRIVIDKASLANAAAGQFFSLWTAGGVPGAGAAPGAAAVPTSATTGAMGFTNQTNPVTSYLAWLALQAGNSASNAEVHDRLAHMGGLSGTVTTAQGALSLVTLAPASARVGDTNYSDVQWWLEIYTALGATGVNATVAVEYNDGTTGNLAAIALGATPRAGRLYPLVSAVAGKFIKAVNSVTLSATTGTAGNFGITATRQRTSVSMPLLNKTETFDWAMLGLPNVANDSCLMLLMMCSTTSTGTLRGQGKIAHG
jgi:hypothetical protein